MPNINIEIRRKELGIKDSRLISNSRKKLRLNGFLLRIGFVFHIVIAHIGRDNICWTQPGNPGLGSNAVIRRCSCHANNPGKSLPKSWTIIRVGCEAWLADHLEIMTGLSAGTRTEANFTWQLLTPNRPQRGAKKLSNNVLTNVNIKHKRLLVRPRPQMASNGLFCK